MFASHFIIKESDCFVKTDSNKAIKIAISSIRKHRNILERFILKYPIFKTTLKPITFPSEIFLPEIIQAMQYGSELSNVGPMASVAGALADMATKEMVQDGSKIAILENGGEISIYSNRKVNIGIYAGNTPLSGKIGFQVKPSECPLGIGTSSATVGHVKSYSGHADAAVIIAQDANLADAFATRITNEVKGNDIEKSVQTALEIAETLEKLRSALIIRGKFIGTVGKLPQLIRIIGENKWDIIKSKYDVIPDSITTDL
ncbi:MAG: UPF0280 family protein [Candidatus Lokiarchaeota archaeon]|nr:UPF0280 family protein [Candidatus Lokiarchaeota archaeon]